MATKGPTKAQLEASLKDALAQAAERAEPQPLVRMPSMDQIRATLHCADENALRNRLRLQAAPWAVASAVCSLGMIGALVSATPALGAAGTGLAIATTLGVLRKARWDRVAELRTWAMEQPFHAAVCALAAWVWTIAAVICGVEAAPGLVTGGLLVFLALAGPWWRAHRIGHLDTVARVGAAAVDGFAQKWEARVGARGKSLPGSKLSGRERTDAGWAYRLRLDPGEQTFTDALSAMPRIASALGVPQHLLLVEPTLPSAADPKPDPAVLWFQVLTHSPVADKVPMGGPDWFTEEDDLKVRIGPFADGVGKAMWRIFSENSMWGGYIVGDTGAGKSVIAEAIAIAAMDTGQIVTWYIDPQQGASSPSLFATADWKVGADADEWDQVLAALQAVVDIRGAENAARLKVSGFTPAAERPGLLVFVDECHNVFFDADRAQQWAKIAREGRKVGVAVVALSQIYGLDAFGGDDALRQSLTGGNTMALRVGRNQASMIHGLDASPADLPNIPGYGLAVAAHGSGGRTAPFRAAWAPENAAKATKSGMDPQVTVEAMMGAAAAKMPALDSLAVGAIDAATDGAYSQRHARHEESLEAMEDRMRALEAGRWTPSPTVPRKATGGLLPDLDEFLGEVEHYANAAPAPGENLQGAERVVFDAVEGGATETAQILAATSAAGYSKSMTHEALNRLCRKELVRRGMKRGTYQPS